MQQRKVPQRMCVACRQMKDKKELMRVVRSPEGTVSVDRTGKASGRGAYICKSAECLARAQKIRALERALDVRMTEDVWQTLEVETKSSE